MKKVRFAEEQMVAILREVDRGPVADVAKTQGQLANHLRLAATVTGLTHKARARVDGC